MIQVLFPGRADIAKGGGDLANLDQALTARTKAARVPTASKSHQFNGRRALVCDEGILAELVTLVSLDRL